MAALPVSVGGWGTREAAAVAALAPFGVPAVLAVGVGLLYGVFALGQGLWEPWPWACRAGLRTEPMREPGLPVCRYRPRARPG